MGELDQIENICQQIKLWKSETKKKWYYKPHGKGRYQSMDKTKVGIKVDDPYWKSEEVPDERAYGKW